MNDDPAKRVVRRVVLGPPAGDASSGVRERPTSTIPPPPEGVSAQRPEVIAAESASRARWRALCEALDGERAALTHERVRGLDAALASWPDAYRTLPGKWAAELLHGGAHPALPLVRRVDVLLHDDVEFSSRYAWASSEGLASARALRVYDERLGDAGAAAFARSPHLGGLVELALATGITPRGIELVADAPALARSPDLALLDLARNRVGTDGVAALGASGHLRGLRALRLGRTSFDRAAVDALAWGGFAPLASLDLDAAGLTERDVAVLCASPRFEGLTELNLSNNALGVSACEAVAACAGLGSLKRLFLHNCRLDDDAVRALLASPHLRSLENLALSENHITDAATRAFLSSEVCATLTELDVCHNPFAPECEPLLRAAMPGLRRLCVT